MDSIKRCRLSVIIPVFNGRNFLVDALAGVQQQTLLPDEIIVIDDGSTDDSWALMESLVDDRIKILRQVHTGAAAARNLGIENSCGELLAFMDCDDLWEPEKLKLQVNLLQQKPEVGIVSTWFREFFCSNISNRVKSRTQLKPGILKGLINSNIMVRRRVFNRVGLYNSRWQTGELMDWWLRAQERGIIKEEVKQVLVTRRLHDNNLSRQVARDGRDYLVILKSSIERRRK